MATAGTPTPPNATQISQDHDAILTYRKLIPTLKEALVVSVLLRADREIIMRSKI